MKDLFSTQRKPFLYLFQIMPRHVRVTLLCMFLPCFSWTGNALVFSSLAVPCAQAATSAQAASSTITDQTETLPFGSNLFRGNFAKGSSGAVLAAGDRVIVRLWGGMTLDDTFTVGNDGAIAIPDVGSIHVSGLAQEELEKSIRSKLSTLASGPERDVQLYVAQLDSHPISVFVTGGVLNPGSYAGTPSDTMLSFLDRAGGIAPKHGSYRAIRLMRGSQEAGVFDLYPFLKRGTLPQLRLQDGDTLVVGEPGPTVTATGEVRNTARFEFVRKDITGADLVELAEVQPKASHVNLSGSRNGAPYSTYLPLREFRTVRLENGDQARFVADSPGDTIMVEVQGAIRGASRFPLRRNVRLSEVQQYIAVDADRANLQGLYIKRKSVAERQKKAIEDALRRLEQNAYTATSASPDEAQIRSKEAEMISNFVTKAQTAQPDGIVVVGANGSVADLTLENEDIIVIPPKSDVVLISGEVMMPQAIVWTKDKNLDDYIRSAGGFSSRADTSTHLVVRPNGEVHPNATDISAGDQVLVLPRVESKNMQGLKDISQVLYQIAVACKVIIEL